MWPCLSPIAMFLEIFPIAKMFQMLISISLKESYDKKVIFVKVTIHIFLNVSLILKIIFRKNSQCSITSKARYKTHYFTT